MYRESNMLPPETVETVAKIVEGGGVAEVKRERDNIVVVEINRRVRNKAQENRP